MYCSLARACTKDTSPKATALSRSQECSSVPSSQKPPHWCTQRCRRNHLDTGKDASGDRRPRLRADPLAVPREGESECAGNFTTILWRSRFTSTSAMPWRRDSDCGRRKCCKRKQTLRKDLTSKEGIVQTWSQDLDLSEKEGCGGWNFLLQFPYLHGTVFFSETSWLRYTGLWQRFPFTGTGVLRRTPLQSTESLAP